MPSFWSFWRRAAVALVVSCLPSLPAGGQGYELTTDEFTPYRLAPPPGLGPDLAVPTTLDRAGRVVAEVRVDGRGPFRFIVDTGANRSAISRRLAAALSLQPLPDQETLVHGITGSAVMPIVEVPTLRVGSLEFADQRVAVLPDAVFGDTDGILGIDALQRARIHIDFVNDRVVVGETRRRDHGGRVVIKASLRHRGLVMVNGRVGRVPVKAIVDTGAERSLGNEALRRALELRLKKPIDGTVTSVVGATAQVAEGRAFSSPSVSFGGVRIDRLVITYGDFHVFRVWSLLEEPALVIGMDLLGTVPEFAIDYPQREFQIRMPAGRLPPVQRG
jgi:predicted aspartyl protease